MSTEEGGQRRKLPGRDNWEMAAASTPSQCQNPVTQATTSPLPSGARKALDVGNPEVHRRLLSVPNKSHEEPERRVLPFSQSEKLSDTPLKPVLFIGPRSHLPPDLGSPTLLFSPRDIFFPRDNKHAHNNQVSSSSPRFCFSGIAHSELLSTDSFRPWPATSRIYVS